MNGRHEILGLVENGRFLLPAECGPLGGSRQLTSIRRQEARPPESGQLNLTEYEGKAIMVTGYADSGWIYEATVIDVAEPILTAVVQKVFGRAEGRPPK